METGIFPDAGTTAVTWDVAIDHCNDLSFGGITTWRLPTQVELQNVYSHSIRQLGYKLTGTERPSGDTLDNNSFFIANVDADFWSATSDANNGAFARLVYFNTGHSDRADKALTSRLLCVSP